MKINKLFHWLYAFLMGLPLLSSLWIGLIWTFNEDAQVPTITENVSKEVDFNQKVRNSNLTNSIEYWSNYDTRYTTLSYSNGGLVTIINNTSASFYRYGVYCSVGEVVIGHKYYIHVDYSINGSFQIYTDSFGGSSYLDPNGKIYTANSLDSNLIILPRGNTINVNDSFTIYYANVFDLTQMFGVGNEPTISEFNSWFYEDYYDYTLSKHIVIEDYSTRQVLDSPVNYIWLPSFGGMGWTIQNVFNNMVSGMFGLATSYGIGLTIVKLLTYWLCISLIWLIYDVIMYVPLMIHRWLDKGVIS